jgi:hypothetical protein
MASIHYLIIPLISIICIFIKIWGRHIHFLTIYKGIFQIAKLTGKGVNLPSIALGEGGFLSNGRLS